MTRARAALLAFALVFAGCASVNYHDASDAARRRQILGHWYDQYMQGLSYAVGDTVYRGNGTFASRYESVAPGNSADRPALREEVEWSGKWRVENGQLIEDITASSDPSRTPADRPMIRAIGRLNADLLTLRNPSGNANEYARKRPRAPKVTFTPPT